MQLSIDKRIYEKKYQETRGLYDGVLNKTKGGKMNEDKKVVERARNYGYCQLFALRSGEDINQIALQSAKNDDCVGMTLAYGLIINRMAYNRAEAELEKGEQC